MATFYVCSNNGVTAVMREEAYHEMNKRHALVNECEKEGLPRPQLPPVRPVFTFADPSHQSFLFMTGSYSLMERLLKGHTVHRGGIWVSFSNGTEWSWGTNWNDDKERKSALWEMKFSTSLDEAVEAFGLAVPESEERR
jgi:hypothetical protein